MRTVPSPCGWLGRCPDRQRHVDERRCAGGHFEGVHAAGQVRPLLRGGGERQVERVRRLAVEHELEPAAGREQGEVRQQRDVVPGGDAGCDGLPAGLGEGVARLQQRVIRPVPAGPRFEPALAADQYALGVLDDRAVGCDRVEGGGQLDVGAAGPRVDRDAGRSVEHGGAGQRVAGVGQGGGRAGRRPAQRLGAGAAGVVSSACGRRRGRRFWSSATAATRPRRPSGRRRSGTGAGAVGVGHAGPGALQSGVDHANRIACSAGSSTCSPCSHGPTIAWYRPVTRSPGRTGALSGRWK